MTMEENLAANLVKGRIEPMLEMIEVAGKEREITWRKRCFIENLMSLLGYYRVSYVLNQADVQHGLSRRRLDIYYSSRSYKKTEGRKRTVKLPSRGDAGIIDEGDKAVHSMSLRLETQKEAQMMIPLYHRSQSILCTRRNET